MSSAVSIATPAIAPPVPTSAKADAIVAVSNGLAQLMAYVKANPEALTWFEQQFGTQLANMAHSTGGSLLGVILGWTFAHFGIEADPTVTLALCGGGVLIGSASWNGVVAIWRGLFNRAASPMPIMPIVPPPTAQEIAKAIVVELKQLSHAAPAATPPKP